MNRPGQAAPRVRHRALNDAWADRGICATQFELGEFTELDDADQIAICDHLCEVRSQCLEAALAEERLGSFEGVEGVRGGRTARQRRQILRAERQHVDLAG